MCQEDIFVIIQSRRSPAINVVGVPCRGKGGGVEGVRGRLPRPWRGFLCGGGAGAVALQLLWRLLERSRRCRCGGGGDVAQHRKGAQGLAAYITPRVHTQLIDVPRNLASWNVLWNSGILWCILQYVKSRVECPLVCTYAVGELGQGVVLDLGDNLKAELRLLTFSAAVVGFALAIRNVLRKTRGGNVQKRSRAATMSWCGFYFMYYTDRTPHLGPPYANGV